MKTLKNIFITLLIVAGCAVAAFFLVNLYRAFFTILPPTLSEESRTPVALVGAQSVRIDIADTDELRVKGLGGRESLESDEGMLFIFPYDARHAVWMKDMKFSIDILWLSADGTIIDMRRDVSPDTYPAAFAPPESARFVLELHAGFTRANGVGVGDLVRLP